MTRSITTSEITSSPRSRKPFRRPVLGLFPYGRYYIARAYYWLCRAAGGPDYFSEITYWQRTLKERPAALFDGRIREAAFPQELRQCVTELGRQSRRMPKLLEVGSGPVSILAAGADEDLCAIVAVDPLARIYRELLRLYDVPYPIQPVPGKGESLLKQFPVGSFDIVYSSNALDHTRSPAQCMEQMCRVLRRGGFMLLEGFEREGTEGKWKGLHKHDLFAENGVIVHMDRAGRRRNLIADLPLTCISEHVRVFKDRTIQSFGYEMPANKVTGAPAPWLLRDWYTLLFRRD